MITQELTERLEKAGFPKNSECGHCEYVGCNPPTLSQLIEECGGCTLIVLNTGESLTYKGKQIEFIHGNSPEEAVANLWLTLNPLNPSVINTPMYKI